MRLRKIKEAKAYLENSEYVLSLDESTNTFIDVSEHTEIELEIGCGKGDFIIKKAKLNPEINFYALEKYDSVLFKAVKKVEKEKLTNLKLILGDAELLEKIFPEKSLSKIYLNFSDPWPKKKHAKRRLTFSGKLEIYESLLKADGDLEMKTDNQGLFESTLIELSNKSWKIKELAFDLYQTTEFSNIKLYQTEYEKKFIRKNQQIFYLKAKQK